MRCYARHRNTERAFPNTTVLLFITVNIRQIDKCSSESTVFGGYCPHCTCYFSTDSKPPAEFLPV